MQKNKIIHISIILAGIIFLIIPAFHNNMWFDESYSVAISNHSFSEIWTIGGNDVHPVLYYWMLHIINIIFGNKIILYRLFSVLCTILIGVIGYTHIRKDFGEKAGIIFSFLAMFLPVNVVYAGEIRMYSFAMLLVTLMSIYAYKIFTFGDRPQQKRTVPNRKGPSPIVNWILFSLFSLASAYTHYYGLMIAGLENLFLFIFYVVRSCKQKKIETNLKIFVISAIAQVLLYMPWLMTLLRQMDGVSKGFWISLKFPESYIQLYTLPFTGNLDTIYIIIPIALIFATFIYAYMLYIHIKNIKEKELNPARFAILFWALIIFSAWLVSNLMSRTILYARYLLCVEGLLIFFIALTMAKRGNKYLNIIVYIISIILSISVLCTLVQENYGNANREFQAYINENIKEEDIFICCNDLGGFIIPATFSNNKLYFFDAEHWNVGPAYKAYGETVYDINFLENYKGRIWFLNTKSCSIYDDVQKKYGIKLIEEKDFSVEYRGYQYSLILAEKQNKK